MTLMMLCQAEGIPPIVAVRRYDIVSGRPAMKSDAMLGDFQSRGGKIAWLVYTETEVTAEFSAPGLSAPVKVTWTIDMANRAGLTSKPGPWKQYPRSMLKARVISEGIRISMPAIISGIYTPEEVADFVPQITPQAERPAIEAEVVPPAAEVITQSQLKAIQTIAGEAKIGDGLPPQEKRAARIAWLVELTGRQVSSTSDLTKDEASKIIDSAKVQK
jgi:hypothetical protein